MVSASLSNTKLCTGRSLHGRQALGLTRSLCVQLRAEQRMTCMARLLSLRSAQMVRCLWGRFLLWTVYIPANGQLMLVQCQR